MALLKEMSPSSQRFVYKSNITSLSERFSDVNIRKHIEELSAKVEFKSHNLYIKGFYNKYSRSTSQTPWIIDNVELVCLSAREFC